MFLNLLPTIVTHSYFMWDYPTLKMNFKVDSCSVFLLPNRKTSQSKHVEITHQTQQSLVMLLFQMSFTNGRKLNFVSADLKAIHHWCIRFTQQ